MPYVGRRLAEPTDQYCRRTQISRQGCQGINTRSTTRLCNVRILRQGSKTATGRRSGRYSARSTFDISAKSNRPAPVSRSGLRTLNTLLKLRVSAVRVVATRTVFYVYGSRLRALSGMLDFQIRHAIERN
eukprot:scaffold116605_cov36-Prasinocladus_malaysianus.AAC.3